MVCHTIVPWNSIGGEDNKGVSGGVYGGRGWCEEGPEGGEYGGSSPMGGGGGDRLHIGWSRGSSLSTGECEYEEEGTPILVGGGGGARLGEGKLKGSSIGLLGASSEMSVEEYEGCLISKWGEDGDSLGDGGVGGGFSTGGGRGDGVLWSCSSVVGRL